jgi:hypothetical protein
LHVRRSLEQIAEKNQPEQHRLNQRKQHAELFSAEPPDPPHRQGTNLLPIIFHNKVLSAER